MLAEGIAEIDECIKMVGSGVAQMVEHHLAKVTVESSSIFTRSIFSKNIFFRPIFVGRFF